MNFGVPLQKGFAVKFLVALLAWKDEVWVVSLKVMEKEWSRRENHFRRKTVETLESGETEGLGYRGEVGFQVSRSGNAFRGFKKFSDDGGWVFSN